MVVVSRPPDDTSKIFFGAWVTLEDSEGKEVKYRLVGPDEFDLGKGYLSIDSPLAKALLKKQVDDEIIFNGPKGEVQYFVLEIAY